MMIQKHLRACALLCSLLLVAPTPFLYAGEKGEKEFKAGEAAAAKQDWDKAVDLYTQAVDKSPKNGSYIIAMRRARFEAAQMHVNRGQKLRADGKLEEAYTEFQKAFIADASSAIAVQELKRTQAMIEDKRPVKAEERGLTPAERARRETEQRIDAMQAPPELKPVLTTIKELKMNNQPPKVLYETVGKMAGVNVVFDSQFQAPNRNYNVELMNNTTAQDAFDYLAVVTHTYWKPISANTIFVTEDNQNKRRDYGDQVVKIFYVTNATSQQEFQEIATAVRTVAEIRRVFTYNAQKAMVVRGDVDAVALAEKLVHDLDKPKAEVVVDVIVMQANSEKTRSIAATIASAGTAGLSVPVTFLPQTSTPSTGTGTTGTTGTTTTTSGAVTLGQLAHLSINDWSTTLPGALLTAMMTDNRTKVLNKPQVRVSDGMKAELKIGERYPYATGSFQPGVATVGVSPLVSTQFNYADIGVNLVIQPQVHSASEVTLHVEVDVTSIQSNVNVGGLIQPVIGQNKSTADLRMRDGEVNIMSGLNQTTDSKTIGGTPGLTDIPVLGKYLFGSTSTDNQKVDLFIALIPHIVRTPDITAENQRGIYAGNDAFVKIRYDRAAEAAPASGSNPPATAPVPASAPPATVPAAPPATVPVSAPAPALPQTSVLVPPSAPSRVRFVPATIEAAVGGAVTVTVQVENVAELFSASPMRVKFNPAQLKLNDVTPGELFTRDGRRVTSVKEIRNDAGEATLTVTRLPGSPGVTGGGAVLTLNFTAIGKGTSAVTLTDFNLKNTMLQPVVVTPAELPVKIQ